MAVLLKDALMPNLVQTLENNPAFIHGGPFANIAHGCNSVIATKTALKLADYVVTEAGFGADLGAEKFFDIKCRKAGLKPAAAVIVATVRALKMHGGVAKADLGKENVAAVKKGCENLARHIKNVKSFGVPVVVAINRFNDTDTEAELKAVKATAKKLGAEGDHLQVTGPNGGAGTEDLAKHVVELVDGGKAKFKPLYPDEMPLEDKIRPSPSKLYGANDISRDATRSPVSSVISRPAASAISRCAWPRRSTASRPIRTPRARRAATPFRSASSGFPRVRSSSSPSPARS